MANFISDHASRRSALRQVIGVGAVSVGLPLLARTLGGDGSPLISAAHAAANPGAQRNQSDLVYIAGSNAPTTTIAEWSDPAAPTGPFRIAASKTALERAPATAARYEAKLYNFPSGSLRVLTFKKGGPVMHLITFETEIYVLQGSATLTPLPGIAGKPVKVSAGDALFLPSGHLSNPRASEDFVILQAFVGRTVRDAKGAIISSKQAAKSETAEWEENGKEVRATKPDEIRKAPKSAHRLSLKRYVSEGNSIRVATLSGGRSANFINNRVDVLIYIAKGKVRRKEGDQMYELVAGDVIREKLGNPGYWEPSEETVFIATDAPVLPGMLPPAST